MPPAIPLLLVATLLTALCSTATAVVAGPPTRFDYRQSLKHPFVAGQGLKSSNAADARSVLVPNFTPVGSAVIASDRIRLVPSINDASGAVWCTVPNPHREWFATISFAATTRAGLAASAGRGFGFWYAKDPNAVGNVYGARETWHGLLIGLDTASLESGRMSPLVYGYTNDGHSTLHRPDTPPEDGGFLGKCYRDYVNAPHRVFVRVSYIGRVLKVEMDLTQGGFGYSECFSKSGVDLPVGFHFGVSAQTSSTTYNDHDLFSLEVSEVNPQHAKMDLYGAIRQKMQVAETNDGLPTNADDLKKIKESEAYVRKAEDAATKQPLPEGFQEAFNRETILVLEENQEKIIKALNLLQGKVGLAPILASRQASMQYDKNAAVFLNPVEKRTKDLLARVDIMLSLVGTLGEDIKQLTLKIKQGFDFGDASIGAIGRLLTDTETKMDKTAQVVVSARRSTSSGMSHTTEYVLFLLIGAVFVWVVRALALLGKSTSSGMSLGSRF
ncbi:legume-like lectin family-domain-containing protein [Chytriomyces sp. MP71]|nr:legume-like lectin family-domain-containing protein [Chytriomyces sp. MP71]